jgi:hypothetical protein
VGRLKISHIISLPSEQQDEAHFEMLEFRTLKVDTVIRDIELIVFIALSKYENALPGSVHEELRTACRQSPFPASSSRDTGCIVFLDLLSRVCMKEPMYAALRNV